MSLSQGSSDGKEKKLFLEQAGKKKKDEGLRECYLKLDQQS